MPMSAGYFAGGPPKRSAAAGSEAAGAADRDGAGARPAAEARRVPSSAERDLS